jgi:hypothetical protein
MILAVPASAIGLTPSDLLFRYRVESYAANTLLAASAVHTYTAGVAGLDFSGGLSGVPVWPDLPGTNLAVTFHSPAYVAHGSQGVLLLHHHNPISWRAEIFSVVTP